MSNVHTIQLQLLQHFTDISEASTYPLQIKVCWKEANSKVTQDGYLFRDIGQDSYGIYPIGHLIFRVIMPCLKQLIVSKTRCKTTVH